MVEEALNAPVKKDFISSYRKDVKALTVRWGGKGRQIRAFGCKFICRVCGSNEIACQFFSQGAVAVLPAMDSAEVADSVKDLLSHLFR
jgi:hypothetical protein